MELRAQLAGLFERYPVRLAYLFGSQATGRARADSDVDVAVLADERLSNDERFQLRLDLIGAVGQALRTDAVDVVLLNDASPVLAYEVLRNGTLLYCASEEERIGYQVRALLQLEDTAPLRRLLTEAQRERLRTGRFGRAPVPKARR